MSKQIMKVFMSEEAKKRVVEVLESGWTGEGPVSKEFEQTLSTYIGRPGCLVNSGTSALELSYYLLDINETSKILCTPMTCAATTMPLVRRNCEIHWIDIDRDGCVNVEDMKGQMQKNPDYKCIIVMDFGGMPCDWGRIMKATRYYDIPVVGDCCQSLGSTYFGKPSLSFPDYATLSLQSVKIVSSVDGGMIFASEKEVERCRVLRWFGIDRFNRDKEKTWEYDILESGYKFHACDTLSVIGLENFRYLQQHVDHNRKIAKIYSENLPKEIVIQEREECKSNFWMYTVLVDNRSGLVAKLKENGIGYGIGHNDNRTYSCVKRHVNRNLPGVDLFAKNHLILPMHFGVTEEDAWEIVEVIKNGW